MSRTMQAWAGLGLLFTGLLLGKSAFALHATEDESVELEEVDTDHEVNNDVLAHAHQLAHRFKGGSRHVTKEVVHSVLSDNRELHKAIVEQMKDPSSETARAALIQRAQPSLMGKNMDGSLMAKDRTTGCFCALTGHKQGRRRGGLADVRLIKWQHQSLSGDKCEERCFFLCELSDFMWEPDEAKILGDDAHSEFGTMLGSFSSGSKFKAATCEEDGDSNRCACVDREQTTKRLTEFNSWLAEIAPEEGTARWDNQKTRANVFRNGTTFPDERTCLKECKGKNVCEGVRAPSGGAGASGTSVCIDEAMRHQ